MKPQVRGRYEVNIQEADRFGPWENGGEYYNTLRECRKARTRIARGAMLPSYAVKIYNQKGEVVE